MPAYSVATAKAGLPRLIDKAMAGEEVIITRHGKPVAEVRPARVQSRGDSIDARKVATERLLAARVTLPPEAPTSVELLDLIYDRLDG